MSTETARVEVYSVGLVCASACAPTDVSREEIEREVNAQHPTGVSSRWRISEETTFATGEPMPSPCNHGAERQHWLLSC